MQICTVYSGAMVLQFPIYQLCEPCGAPKLYFIAATEIDATTTFNPLVPCAYGIRHVPGLKLWHSLALAYLSDWLETNEVQMKDKVEGFSRESPPKVEREPERQPRI
jgi:hypothetical protein